MVVILNCPLDCPLQSTGTVLVVALIRGGSVTTTEVVPTQPLLSRKRMVWVPAGTPVN